jgi:hypothetical protein
MDALPNIPIFFDSTLELTPVFPNRNLLPVFRASPGRLPFRGAGVAPTGIMIHASHNILTARTFMN